MGLFLERNSSRQGREGKMVFHFTGAEIPQRNTESMIGNTVLCQSSDLAVEGKHPGGRRPGLRGGCAGRVRRAHTPTRALSVAPGVPSPAQTDSSVHVRRSMQCEKSLLSL